MVLQEKYINLFTDFGFKKIFGTEPNKDLLIDFLNEVVLPRQRKIVNLTYKKNEHLGSTEFDRKAIFDLYCIGSNDERFIVEMQKAKQNYFKDRSVFYATFPIQEQAIRGSEWDYKLAEVFTVGVLDFVFGESKTKNKGVPSDEEPQVIATETKEVRHVVKLKDQKNQVFYDRLTFIYLEMPNFTKKIDELVTHYDKWLYVLKNLATLPNRPDMLQEKVFEHLFEVAEIAKFTSTEREQYEESLKSYRDLKNVIDTSFGEGKMEGKMEEKTEIITTLILQGILTDAQIASVTKTTLDAVQKIQQKMSKMP